MNHNPILKVDALVKHYGTVRAVDQIDFELAPGELVALIGPNGAGKTTTYRCIVGLQRPDRGQIWIGGLDIHQQRVDALQQLGYVGQDLQLFQYLTGEEMLRLVGEIYEVDADRLEPRIDQLLQMLDLKSAAHRLVRHYSGGMARKLAIATALLREPPMLLLDESFAGLDPESTAAIREELDRMRRNGTAILLSSHVLEMVERWVDRVIIMCRGKIVEDVSRPHIDQQLATGFDSLTSLYLDRTRTCSSEDTRCSQPTIPPSR